VPWRMRELVGVAADALMKVADEEDALMIVVGARPGGFRGALRQVFTGSVALRLAHRQYRPVVVVPTAPEETDAALLADLG
jgi:nucleotide-binding universal stress UspA family protein